MKLITEFQLKVPPRYHDGWIDQFGKRAGRLGIRRLDAGFITSNFIETTKLKSGETYLVKICEILVDLTRTEGVLEFLKKERALLVGACGTVLVAEFAKRELPLGKRVFSFFGENASCVMENNCCLVPFVARYSSSATSCDVGLVAPEHIKRGDCLMCFHKTA